MKRIRQFSFNNSISVLVKMLIHSYNEADTLYKFSQIEYFLEIPQEALRIEEIEFGDRYYSSLTLPGFDVNAEFGYPLLPFTVRSFAIPFNSTYRIIVNGEDPQTIQLSKPVLAKPSQIIREEPSVTYSPINPPDYSLNQSKMKLLTDLTPFPNNIGFGRKQGMCDHSISFPSC